jgi:fumarate reductase subunit D
VFSKLVPKSSINVTIYVTSFILELKLILCILSLNAGLHRERQKGIIAKSRLGKIPEKNNEILIYGFCTSFGLDCFTWPY